MNRSIIANIISRILITYDMDVELGEPWLPMIIEDQDCFDHAVQKPLATYRLNTQNYDIINQHLKKSLKTKPFWNFK